MMHNCQLGHVSELLALPVVVQVIQIILWFVLSADMGVALKSVILLLCLCAHVS